MDSGTTRRVETRSTCVLHIYDSRNPKAGCYCCDIGDVASVVAPRWVQYIPAEHLCGNCLELAAAEIALAGSDL